nr:hypothetical protein [Tanacetum cinerariifolium]
MATIIEQQVALDEALVPSTQRCPFFKAFLVTADVPEIYMQEFWATAYVHQHSIRFIMDNKKHIVNLEIFRDMLHICPRIHGQSFDELPFEKEILDFLRNIDYAFLIWEDFVYQVEKKNHKSNEMYYPRFTKVIIHHFMLKNLSIPRQNKVNWHYVRDDMIFSTIKVVSRHQNTQQYGAMLPIEFTNEKIINTKAYKEYYIYATREATPKPKASARRKRSGSDSSTNPLTADRDDDEGYEKDESDDGEEDDDEEKIAKIDEHDDTERGGDDDEESESDEESDDEETREEESFDPIPRTPEDIKDDGNDEEDQGFKDGEEEWLNKEEEADELYRDVDINQGRGLQLSQDIKDSHVTLTLVKLDGVESIFATASSSVAPLPTPTPTMTPSIIATITTASQATIPPTPIPREVLQNLPTFDSVFRFDERLKSLEASFSEYRQTNPFAKVVFNISSVNAQLEAKVLTRSSHSSRTSYVVAADLSEMELKKILIEKMEGNKSIQRSDEQRNLYKALIEAYEADKIILDTYEEIVTLKRRRNDESDKDEGPSAGSDRGSKRRKEGKEPESTSAPLQTATRSAGRSTTGSKSQQASTSAENQPIVQSSQHPEWFSQPKKPPTSDRDWNKTLPAVQGSTQTWISELAKQADSRSSFNELLDTPLEFSNFIMNRLKVDTLTPELLARPTYELMKGSCKSLTELEYHLEEPFPLIPDNRGRRVIPFAHFINNDLEYLRGGVSHWGQKRQQFYGFAINRESSLDVYSKRRIIAVTNLKIMEWHNYKHLDWITVRRDDEKIYKFKEGDFKSEEKRILPIQTKEDSSIKNKDKKNRLMRIDELYKFSDGMLNDIRNALDDRMKRIRMQYLPQTIWRKGDKDRAAAMIQAIDKMLKTRRIMRSLERFVGGRLNEGDFLMLQRTI